MRLCAAPTRPDGTHMRPCAAHPWLRRAHMHPRGAHTHPRTTHTSPHKPLGSPQAPHARLIASSFPISRPLAHGAPARPRTGARTTPKGGGDRAQPYNPRPGLESQSSPNPMAGLLLGQPPSGDGIEQGSLADCHESGQIHTFANFRGIGIVDACGANDVLAGALAFIDFVGVFHAEQMNHHNGIALRRISVHPT